jgi:hypothetical protein
MSASRHSIPIEGADIASCGLPAHLRARGLMGAASDITPLGAVARGLTAGVAGTAAMTAAQSAFYKAQGYEPSTTPAEVAKRIIRGVFHRRVDEQKTQALNNAMHWTYGTSWGVVYGLAQGTVHARAARHGLLFGSLVWGTSLIHLPAMKLAPPVWKYEPAQIASDLSFHLIYGEAVALAYGALRG